MVLMALALAVPVLVTLRAWLVDDTLSGGAALAILGALFVALAAVWQSQGTVWVFLWIAGIVAACAAVPLLSGGMNKRALREMASESIARYQSALARDPRNAGAHAYLADAYMECGRVEDAITAYRQAITLDPDHSRAEQSKLRRALEGQQGRQRPTIRVCEDCRGETPAGEKTCLHCGAALEMGFFAWLAQPESLRAITRQTVMVMLVVTVLYTVFSALPLEVKGCVLIATICVGAFYFLRSIQG